MTRSTWILVAVAVGSSISRLILVWSGWPESALIADDGFYYFTIARHWVEGHGVSFDGLTETNGFHPLWLLLLRPIFGLAATDLWTPVRAALTLSVVLDLVSAGVLFRAVRTVAGNPAASIATVLWVVSPYTYFLGLRGMESSLSALLVLLLYARLVRLDASLQDRLSPRTAISVGVLLAATGWARTDNLIVAGGALVAWLVWRATCAPLEASRHLRWLVRVVLVSVVCMMPWFVWSIVKFGSIVQVSALMKLHVADYWGQITWDTSSFATTSYGFLRSLLAPVLVPTRFLVAEEFGPARFYGPVSAALVVTALPVLVLGSRRTFGAKDQHIAQSIVFPVSYISLHVFLFGFVGRSYATWYLHPAHALFCALIGFSLPTLLRGSRWWRLTAVLWLMTWVSVFAMEYALYGSAKGHGARGPELRHRPAFEQILRARPQGAVAGAFDAGAIGYVATAYPTIVVVNLDGLVNNAVYRAYRAGRYRAYVESTIDVGLQDMRGAARFCGPEEAMALQRHFGRGVEQREPGEP